MSKKIGTPVETAVVKFLKANGFPNAERRALSGSADKGDVAGLGPIVVEVKGGKAAETASDGQIEKWLQETEVERIHANADYGLLVTKRRGIGYLRAGEWWAILPAYQFLGLCWPKAQHHAPGRTRLMPVRVHLAHAVTLLRIRGYGDELPAPSA